MYCDDVITTYQNNQVCSDSGAVYTADFSIIDIAEDSSITTQCIKGISGDIGFEFKNNNAVVSNNTICCRAYESCMNITKIKSNDGNLVCDGYYSCRESKLLKAKFIYCRGGQSCVETSIDFADPPEHVVCSGSSSCRDAFFSASWRIACVANDARSHPII